MLTEIHREEDLKLNLKFEIELLCRNLNVDINKIETIGVLKDTERLVRVYQRLVEPYLEPTPSSQPSMGIAPPIDRRATFLLRIFPI